MKVIIPIPKDETIAGEITRRVQSIIDYRISAREIIGRLSEEMCS